MRRGLALTLMTTGAITLAVSLFDGRQAVTAPAPAEKAPAATASAGEKSSKERKLKITAPNGTLNYDDVSATYIITNATVELPDSDAVLTASRIEYNERERWMRATGKPRMWDEHNEITADVIRADTKAKRTDAEGTVRMVARPKPAKTEAGRKARDRVKEPVIINCDTMQYFYKDKRGTGTGNLKITQKDSKADRTATGARLSYDGNEEIVVLEGDVRVTNTKGEGFACRQVTFNIKDGSEGFRIEGLRDAVFYFEEDDEEGDKKPAPTKKDEKAAPASNGNGQKPANNPAPAGQ